MGDRLLSSFVRGVPGPAGPPGSSGSGSGAPVFSAINGENFTLAWATPVYRGSNGEIKQAFPIDVKNGVVGLVFPEDGIVADESGQVLADGLLAGTLLQWETAGQIGGLAIGQRYFLGNDGLITVFAPVDDPPATHLVAIGRALSATDLLVNIEPPIDL